MTAEERMVIFASSLGTVFEWYDFYIYGTLAPILAAQFFAGVNPIGGVHLHPARLCRRLRRPAIRRAVLRPPRRPDRPQVHLPDHHDPDGPRHVRHRPAAQLRRLGHCRPDHADLPAPVPGSCARRRIWRRGDLRRRACPEEQARLLHVLDPDHGDRRPVHGAADRARYPHLDGRDRVRRPRQLDRRLAHSIPALRDPARGLDLDQTEAQRIAGLPADEGRGPRARSARCPRLSANGPT